MRSRMPVRRGAPWSDGHGGPYRGRREMKAQGLLTEDEFAAEKARVLGT